MKGAGGGAEWSKVVGDVAGNPASRGAKDDDGVGEVMDFSVGVVHQRGGRAKRGAEKERVRPGKVVQDPPGAAEGMI